MMRAALVSSDNLRLVAEYLPSNYKAVRVTAGKKTVVIGEDNHGWTLDAYVIPRLGSALLIAHEFKIRTENINPPIPDRRTDWAAWIDGDEFHGCAYGHNEREAVESLIDREVDYERI